MTSKKVLLITGGSGYLGRYLTTVAEKSFAVHTTYRTNPDQIVAGTPHQLDITDKPALVDLVAGVAPDAIIHTAAVNPGHGEEAMMAVNQEGSRNVAIAAAMANARLVHVSSDIVHSGQDAPYSDGALPTPINTYGHSKAAAETAVAKTVPNATIVRTSLIYGLHEMDRGTAGFAKRLESGEILTLFSDVIRQPVWIDTLVEALLKLAFDRSDFAGTLNIAGRQALSRKAFGLRLLNWWKIEHHSQVIPGFAADMGVNMPLDLRLDISRGEAILEMRFPGVDEILNL